MSDRHGLAWLGASILVSVLIISAAGLNQLVPVHWGITGKPDLVVPSWLIAVLFPVILSALLATVLKSRPTRLVGNSRKRTIALIGLGLVGAEGYIFLNYVDGRSNPLFSAILIIGVLLSAVGNFWAKDAEPEGAGGRRPTGVIIFVHRSCVVCVRACGGDDCVNAQLSSKDKATAFLRSIGYEESASRMPAAPGAGVEVWRP